MRQPPNPYRPRSRIVASLDMELGVVVRACSAKAVILIILTLIILSLMAALIAGYPFAAAARLPS